MIEQRENQLVMTFPSAEAAQAFHLFLQSLLAPREPGTSALSSELLQGTDPPPPPPSSDPPRSCHTVLTPERQDALAQQRELGLTSRQRLLRAQTTLRDGTLPFSRPTGQPPPPSSQDSPRIRAARQGGFADGAPEAGLVALGTRPIALPQEPQRGSRLRSVPPSPKT
jgi:hypothetical protein